MPSSRAIGGDFNVSRTTVLNAFDALSAEGYFIVDLTAAYRWRFLEVGLVVENVLNSSWREAQFANTSYVVGRDDPAKDPRNGGHGVEDIVFTPGKPISVRGTLAVYF